MIADPAVSEPVVLVSPTYEVKAKSSLSNVFRALSWDLTRYAYRLGMSRLYVVVFSPGFQAGAVYRIGHWVDSRTSNPSGIWRLVGPLFSLIMAIVRRFSEIVTGIYISPEAEIGEGLLMIHFGGIVVGPSVIGKNCEIYQQVTLGISKSARWGEVPTLGDRVYLAPGSKVLGNITLGDDVVIGPNSVALNSVPDRAVVLGVPGRSVAKKGSFDLVLYPGMEDDVERQKSLDIMLVTANPDESMSRAQVGM